MHSKNDDAISEIEIPKKKKIYIYISPEERQQIIDELRLVPKKGCIFLEIIDELKFSLKERYISLEKRQQIIDELKLV